MNWIEKLTNSLKEDTEKDKRKIAEILKKIMNKEEKVINLHGIHPSFERFLDKKKNEDR